VSSNHRTISLILLIGFVLGLLFAILTNGTGYVNNTFVALATVQGAFIGIVFSIFILASQVNATEFSPLTLEQLGESNTFLALLGFYIISIFYDIYILQTQGDWDFIPEFAASAAPSFLNYTVGAAVSLASISLLSLILARRLLVSLTTPKNLLEANARKVSRNAILEKSQSDGDLSDLKPERTSLLTIERILSSSSDRDDEYTVQLSIYYMYDAITRLLREQKWSLVDKIYGREVTELSELNFDVVLTRWNTCVEYGTEGPLDRTVQTYRLERRIIESFIASDRMEIAEKQISKLTNLYQAILQEEHYESDLLDEYISLAEYSLQSNSTGVLLKVETEILRVPRLVLSSVDELEGGRREVVSTSLSYSFEIIGYMLNNANIGSPDRRVLTRDILNEVDHTLEDLFEYIDESESNGVKQNILNDIYRTLLPITVDASNSDEVVFDRLIICLAEISVELGKEAEEVQSDLVDHSEEPEALKQDIGVLYDDVKTGDSEIRQLTSFVYTDKKITNFVRDLH